MLSRLGVTLRLLLLLGSLVLMTAVATTTAHHGSDTLVSDLRTSSESHTGCHGAHETTAAHHAASLLLGSSRVGSGWSLGGSGWCSR